MLKEFITSARVGSRQMYRGNTEVENHALFFIFSNGVNLIENMSTRERRFPFFDMSNEQLGNSEYFDNLSHFTLIFISLVCSPLSGLGLGYQL